VRHTTVKVKSFPKCDFCPEEARYDGMTKIDGHWAYMCESCFSLWGVGLGLGMGQKLVKRRTKKMKIWKPKNPRDVALIKLVLWAGLVTWIIFTLATGIVIARLAAVLLPRVVGTAWGQILTWVVPIWIIFTTFMLIWAVVRFANRKLRKEKEEP
jgi:hypothetical protein